MIFENDNLNATNVWLSGTKLEALNKAIFYKLVPYVGEAKTTAGKMLARTNHMLYRLGNDGDVYPALSRMGFCRYDDWNSRRNVDVLYTILDNCLSKVIKTKAGKEALKGTDFEYLINN